MDRPKLRRALDDVLSEKGTVLVAYDLSRICRIGKEAIDIVDTLDKHGCHLSLATQGEYDTTTPNGRFIVSMFGLLAELDRSNRLEMSNAAMDVMREQGKCVGPVPIGIQKNKAGYLEPNPREQAAMLTACILRSKRGMPYRKIVEVLKTNFPYDRKKRKRGTWQLKKVHSIVAGGGLMTIEKRYRLPEKELLEWHMPEELQIP